MACTMRKGNMKMSECIWERAEFCNVYEMNEWPRRAGCTWGKQLSYDKILPPSRWPPSNFSVICVRASQIIMVGMRYNIESGTTCAVIIGKLVFLRTWKSQNEKGSWRNARAEIGRQHHFYPKHLRLRCRVPSPKPQSRFNAEYVVSM